MDTFSAPSNWSIGEATLQDASLLLRSLLADVDDPAAHWQSLPTTLPVYYDHYCRRRYLAWRQMHPSVHWDDVEPVFALAAVTAPSGKGWDAEARRRTLQANFLQLRGTSRLEWHEVERLIIQAWSALAALE
jgi:hypothetical protein